MGSGTAIQRAIKKYGLANFKKDILHNFKNPEDMFAMESDLVNKEFILREDTYNIKEGGSGGWEYVNKTGKNFNGLNFKNHTDKLKNDPVYKKNFIIESVQH